jgi:hypothetical protein
VPFPAHRSFVIQHWKHVPLFRALLESLLWFGVDRLGLPSFSGDVPPVDPDEMPWAFELKDGTSPVLTGFVE